MSNKTCPCSNARRDNGKRGIEKRLLPIIVGAIKFNDYFPKNNKSLRQFHWEPHEVGHAMAFIHVLISKEAYSGYFSGIISIIYEPFL